MSKLILDGYSSWNLPVKKCKFVGLKFISDSSIVLDGIEDCKFIECEFEIRKEGMILKDCIGVEFIDCKWDMACIANYGIEISNAKIRFQSCAMKFQSSAIGQITGISIKKSSLVRIYDLDLFMTALQLESKIIGIEMQEDELQSSKVWLNAINYNLDAPETIELLAK